MGKSIVIEPPEVPFETTAFQESKTFPALDLPDFSSPMPSLPESILSSSPTPNDQPEEKKGFFKKLFSKKNPAESRSPFADLEKSSASTMPTSDNAFLPPFGLPLPVMETVLPEFPPLTLPDAPLEKSGKKKNAKAIGKSKGKAMKGNARVFNAIDEKSQFDWSRPITDQDLLIQDNSRYNEDIAALIDKANTQFLAQKELTKPDNLQTDHTAVTAQLPELLALPQTSDELTTLFTAPAIADAAPIMPRLSPEVSLAFKKINDSHQKIRGTLERTLKKKATTGMHKTEVMQLLKQYDESIEQKIEHKELELFEKSKKLKTQEKLLHAKELQLKHAHLYLKKFEKDVHQKEELLNSIISKNVELQLAKRLTQEKLLLKKEIIKTQSVNKELQKKLNVLSNDRARIERKAASARTDFERERTQALDTLEKDRVSQERKAATLRADFERERTQVLSGLEKDRTRQEQEFTLHKQKLEQETNTFLEKERTKLNEMQGIYEKKLAELTTERMQFAKEKAEAHAMLERAGEIAQELQTVKRIRNFIEHDKKKVDARIIQNKELENAIAHSEALLKKEREDVEKLAFSKYISSNLQTAGSLDGQMQVSYKLLPLYDLMKNARLLIDSRDIDSAKREYNKVKGMFERMNLERIERETIYSAIRELYNDIQLALLDQQLQM
ncbi:MAG: hypothetical protein WC916_05775 [Candidatus Woesearchaeota archaeon]